MNHEPYPWVTFAIYICFGLVALLLSLPFPPRITLLLPGIVVLVGVVGAGLLLARSSGLPVSAIESRAKGANGWSQLPRLVGQSVLVGAGLGVVMLLAIRFLFVPILPVLQSRFTAELDIAAWKRVVIAFDSGVLEELMFRLLLLSLSAWLLGKFWHNAEGFPTRGALWTVNMLIAIGFGLAHLPRWESLTPLTLPVVAAVVFLNGVGGLLFGWLYFSQSLEGAMLAHFAADVVLHVVGPGFLKP